MALKFVLYVFGVYILSYGDLRSSLQASEVSDSPTECCGYKDCRLFNDLVSVAAIICNRLNIVTLSTGMNKI
jgi:hypothetical protein